MTISPLNFKATVREGLLDLIWRQWSALGVAGHASGAPDWAVDIEALVLVTTRYGRADPRLFDEMLDWLWGNAQWVNVQRLRNIQKKVPLGDECVLSAIAAWLCQRSPLLKWKPLVTTPANGDPPTVSLFRFQDGREMPVRGEVDPIFARHGLMRPLVERREMSRPPNPQHAAALAWKLRCIWGVQARCEFILWLIAHERGHAAEIARATYYYPRTVEDALRELTASGLVRCAQGGRSNRYWIDSDAWMLFLRSWENPRGFPKWFDWPRLFYCLDRFIHVGEGRELSPLLHASELRRIFEEMLPALETGELRILFSANRKETGERFTSALRNDIEALFQRLSGA
jgi:hypothetical protein